MGELQFSLRTRIGQSEFCRSLGLRTTKEIIWRLGQDREGFIFILKTRKESEDMKKMEQLANVKAFLCMVFGAIAGGFVNLIGGWSEDLTTLLIFMGVDFVLGLLIAAFWKKSNKSENGALSSYSAWKGLCRKGVSLLIVLIAYRLDVTLGVDYIRTAVVLAFIANEGISILENVGIMGVKYPEALKKALDVLTNKSQEQEGE
nr:MAG TPA: holin [Caudoviricetes sp.]